MVNSTSIFFMILSFILSVILPITLIIFVKKKYKVSLKPFLVGVLAFFISAEILENLLHLYFLNVNPTTTAFFANSAIAYAIYGGLAAGIFEESARYISFKYFLKQNRNFLDGISYGLGHGSIESILIGGIAALGTISNSLAINSGKFTSISEKAGIPTVKINMVIDQYVNTPVFQWITPGIERVLALAIQIGLSIIVLYAIKERKKLYFFAAIAIHAIVDIPAALYQKGAISNIYILYLIIFIEACLILTCAFKFLRPKFSKKDNNDLDKIS
ncbi:YhfC family intramembrane metalloprotease [Clostridium sp. HBUAS56017]|uniref:YhfC family intramembrane metalloprotease n=1 Tax=Clostridium sp. HBUAS56017 TaxID=2571128 RepID=UPI0011783F28|nr:YhfC family intramembrane metalloprotease [Clostridium sp. HBUAS56017]